MRYILLTCLSHLSWKDAIFRRLSFFFSADGGTPCVRDDSDRLGSLSDWVTRPPGVRHPFLLPRFLIYGRRRGVMRRQQQPRESGRAGFHFAQHTDTDSMRHLSLDDEWGNVIGPLDFWRAMFFSLNLFLHLFFIYFLPSVREKASTWILFRRTCVMSFFSPPPARLYFSPRPVNSCELAGSWFSWSIHPIAMRRVSSRRTSRTRLL